MEIEKKKDQEEHIPHPNYLGVFVALVVLTALEVAVTYTPLPRVPVLVPLAVIKAALVVLFYMHLKFDRKIFGVLFGMGLLMGIGLLLSLLILYGFHLT